MKRMNSYLSIKGMKSVTKEKRELIGMIQYAQDFINKKINDNNQK